jgi:hypothetical protein
MNLKLQHPMQRTTPINLKHEFEATLSDFVLWLPLLRFQEKLTNAIISQYTKHFQGINDGFGTVHFLLTLSFLLQVIEALVSVIQTNEITKVTYLCQITNIHWFFFSILCVNFHYIQHHRITHVDCGISNQEILFVIIRDIIRLLCVLLWTIQTRSLLSPRLSLLLTPPRQQQQQQRHCLLPRHLIRLLIKQLQNKTLQNSRKNTNEHSSFHPPSVQTGQDHSKNTLYTT